MPTSDTPLTVLEKTTSMVTRLNGLVKMGTVQVHLYKNLGE